MWLGHCDQKRLRNLRSCAYLHAQVDLVLAAAEAAAEAVGGDLDGPAAAAARRAAASGLAASQQGFKGLGGASQHMAALRELVALPLQARPCLRQARP